MEMFENLNIQSFTYDRDRHTFVVSVSVNGTIVKRILDYKNFPESKSFKILDEELQILEPVLFWPKAPEDLIKAGWKKSPKGTLSHPDHPFKIGKDKADHLTKPYLEGAVGINESLKPYIFLNNGYRFSPAEIKIILKKDFFPKGESIQSTGKTLIFNYENQSKKLQIGSQILYASDIAKLTKFLLDAKLV